MSSPVLFPTCPSCLAIPTKEKGWVKSPGQCVKTTDKLSKCTGCFFARYCGKDCQTADWKSMHKNHCKNFKENKIDVLEVDKLVKLHCEALPGNVVLCFDEQKKFIRLEKETLGLNLEYLIVAINLAGKVLGFCMYTICSRNRDFVCPTKPHLKESIQLYFAAGSPNDPQCRINRGLKMIEQGLHLEAFQMMAKLPSTQYNESLTRSIHEQEKAMFFPDAVRFMASLNVEKDAIDSCAVFLQKTPSDVTLFLQPPLIHGLSEDMQKEVTNVQNLVWGIRDDEMVLLSSRFIDMLLIDQAFNLIRDWVGRNFCKVQFLTTAAPKMAQMGLPYKTFVEYSTKLGFSEADLQIYGVKYFGCHP